MLIAIQVVDYQRSNAVKISKVTFWNIKESATSKEDAASNEEFRLSSRVGFPYLAYLS